MLDSKGVITSDRPNLTESKKFFATDRRDVHTLEEAIKGADVSRAYPKETFSHKTWCAVWPIIQSYSLLPTLLPKFPTKMLWHHARMS